MRDAVIKSQDAGFSREEREAALESPELQQFIELLADINVNSPPRGRYYAVDVVCPKSGERHRLPEDVWLDDGPEGAGSLGDYCVSQERVPRIVSILDEEGWCEAEGGWVLQTNCNQVFLMAVGPSE
jgi:hypothetical protein